MKLHNCDKDVIICSDRSAHERREGKTCVAWPCWITIASSLSFISARSTILSSTVLSVINLKTCTCFFWPIRWARSWNRADQFNVHQNYSQNKIVWHSDLKQTLVFTPRHSMHSVLLHTVHVSKEHLWEIVQKFNSAVMSCWRYGQVCIQAKWPIMQELISKFQQHQCHFYSPLDGMLVYHKVPPSIKFASTHLYIWVEWGTIGVKSPGRVELKIKKGLLQ